MQFGKCEQVLKNLSTASLPSTLKVKLYVVFGMSPLSNFAQRYVIWAQVEFLPSRAYSILGMKNSKFSSGNGLKRSVAACSSVSTCQQIRTLNMMKSIFNT